MSDRSEGQRRESARQYAEEGPGRRPTEAEKAKSAARLHELMQKVEQIEAEEHQGCIDGWERRAANGAMVTKHGVDAHRRCHPDLGVHTTPHRGCILR